MTVPAGRGHHARHLVLDEHRHAAPLLTGLWRQDHDLSRLAEEALDRLSRVLPDTPHWTANSTLPGGDFAHDKVDAMVTHARAYWPFLSEQTALRLVRAYGTRLDRVLGTAKSVEQLGPRFGSDLTAAEVRYLMKYEWARTIEDVLWRRTKIGVWLTKPQRDALAAFMTGEVAGAIAC